MALVAGPSDYGAITLSWNVPAGSWDHMMLVRNSHGTPITQLDGTVLFDLNCGPEAAGSVGISYPAVSTVVTPYATGTIPDYSRDIVDVDQSVDPIVTGQFYVDTGLSGGVYYYALFVRKVTDALYPGPTTFPSSTTFPGADMLQWIRTDIADALAVINGGAGDNLLHLLPSIYTNPDRVQEEPLDYPLWVSGTVYLTGTVVEGSNRSLYQAVVTTSPVNFTVDPTTDVTNSVWTPVPGSATALQSFLSLFGFDQDHTQQLMAGLLLVRDAKSMDGVLLPAFASMLGYGYEFAIGTNQNRELLANAAFLNQHKGTAVGITGLASAVTGYGAVLEPLTNLMHDQGDSTGAFSPTRWVITTGGSLAAHITPPSAPNVADPDGGLTCFRLTSAATTETIQFPASDFRLQGIPVNVAETYTFSGFLSQQSAANSSSLVPGIIWADADGNVLSTATGSATATPATTTDWGRFSFAGTAPAGAVWAGLTATVTMTALDTVYLSDYQFQPGALSDYQRARNLDIELIADRINLVANSGFDFSDSGWSARDGSIAQTSAVAFNHGKGSLTVTPAGGMEPPLYPGPTTFPSSTTYPGGGDPGLFVEIPVTAEEPFTFAAQVLPQSPSAYQLQVQWVDGSNNILGNDFSLIFNATTVWDRLYLTSTAPPLAAMARLFILQVDGSDVVFNLDDVLAEATSVLQPYFDDVTFAGDAFLGCDDLLYYYQNFVYRLHRLAGLLHTQIPLGATFDLLYAGAPCDHGVGGGEYGEGIYGDGLFGA